MKEPNKLWVSRTIVSTCLAVLLASGCAQRQPGIIRLHVVANSNSPGDQSLKLKVRDEVLRILGKAMAHAPSEQAAAEAIAEHLPDIARSVSLLVQRTSPGTGVNVEFGTYPFPERQYGDVIVPAGKYLALRVVLGDGTGDNWWCVLFPPLCLVDVAGNYNVDKEKLEILKKALEAAYAGGSSPLVAEPPKQNLQIQIRSALIDLLRRAGVTAKLRNLATLLIRLGH
ncbi:MAG: stage II sporulation protein R [Bacillota bacterium]